MDLLDVVIFTYDSLHAIPVISRSVRFRDAVP